MTQKEHDLDINDPDARNSEQVDEDAQAQTVARDAERAPTDAAGESTRGGRTDPAQLTPGDTPDLVERMKDMDHGGRIDMDAFEGEENMDDEDGSVPE